MNQILISQSMLRDFYGNDNYPPICRQLFYEKYFNGFTVEPSDSMKMGLAFESKLLGASRGGFTYELPKLKSGQPSAAEKEIDAAVDKAKVLLDRLHFEAIELQPVWMVNDLLAHPDVVAKSSLSTKAVIDIKFTGFSSTDRFSPWFDIERVDKLQAIHYIYVNYLLTGEYLPFYFFIFFKDGGVKIIDCKLTVNALNAHIALLDEFRGELAKMKPHVDVEADYNVCVKCPLFGTCQSAAKTPMVLELVA